jgi:D-alanyl-D-alanine carboxypeptidase
MAIQFQCSGLPWWRWRPLLACLLATGLAVVASGAHAESRSAVLVLDANTGRVLHESAADAPRHPASLAKMMTLYIVFELMEQGRLSPNTRIKMSANAVATAPSRLDLDEGEEIALVDAIGALITKSANDVAVAVAEHVAGSEQKFARLMTQKARQLGMAATTFRNASGLPDDEQLSTARDMATLALRLQDDFPRQYPFFAMRTFTYKDETFRNHNTLLFHYPGTDGLKTGYTRASGFNLVASVRRGGKHVIGVVFGGASAASRNAAMRTFLSAGLVKASSEKTRKPAAPLVARAKRTPEPKIATMPTPQRVERAAPKPLPPAPSPPAPVQASSEPAPAIAPPASPAVEMARVRQVLVSTRAAEPAGEPPPHSIEALLEAPASARDTNAEPGPSPQRLRWVSANAGGSRVHVAATPAERPAPASDPAAAREPAPSTLDARAANLARSAPPVETPAPALVRAPAAPPAPSALASGFHIQIGAYQSEADAQRQLALVRERAAAVVSARTAVTQPVKQGDKLFYRARYAGFEAHTAAAQACSEIKRLKLDCIVLKAE